MVWPEETTDSSILRRALEAAAEVALLAVLMAAFVGLGFAFLVGFLLP